MEYISLGSTSLLVSRTAFSARSLEEVGDSSVVNNLVEFAYDGGINFFYASHSKPESEKLLGGAIKAIKNDILLSTKTQSFSAQEIRMDLDESLSNFQVDKIDIFFLKEPNFIPEHDGVDGIYSALEALKASGKIRHVGISTEDFELANSCIEKKDPLWEVIAHPFNMLCPKVVEDFTVQCGKNNVGFIAQRPLCGGIIQNLPLALGYLRRFEDVVPVWSVKNMDELQQILYFTENPPVLDDQFHKEAGDLRDFFA